MNNKENITPYYVKALIKYGNTIISKETCKKLMEKHSNTDSLFKALEMESDGRLKADLIHAVKVLPKKEYQTECLLLEMVR